MNDFSFYVISASSRQVYAGFVFLRHAHQFADGHPNWIVVTAGYLASQG